MLDRQVPRHASTQPTRAGSSRPPRAAPAALPGRVAAAAPPDALAGALGRIVAARGLVQREITQEASYASGAGERQSLVPRGEIQTETHEDTTYVRVYQTVYAAVEGSSKFKDVHQKSDGAIEVRGTGDMWLNAGRPWRAFHYVRTYVGQAPGKVREAIEAERKASGDVSKEQREAIERKHGRPVIRSFLIPHATYRALTGSAISEKQVGEYGTRHNLSVDKSKDSDQFLVRGRDVRLIRATAKPHSLISYVLDNLVDQYTHARHGTVKPLTELLAMLGMPLDLWDPLLLPLTEKHTMQKDTVQAQHAERLHQLYQASFELERAQPDPAKLHTLAELSRELLGTETWPAGERERAALRERVAAAATYALVPSLLRENYEEAAARMFGSDSVNGKPLSAWMASQTFETVPIEPRPARQALSAEAIAAKEAKARATKQKRDAAKLEAATADEDTSSFALFGGDEEKEEDS